MRLRDDLFFFNIKVSNMNVQKSFFYGLFLAFLLVFSGCSGNNSDSPVAAPTGTDLNTTVPVVLPPADTNVTSDIASFTLDSSNVYFDPNTKETSLFVTNADPVTLSIGALNVNNGGATSGSVGVLYPTTFNAAPSQVVGISLASALQSYGTMSPNTSAPLVDGIATFTYTPPTNVADLITAGYKGVTFTFYDVTHPTNNFPLSIVFTNPKYTKYVLTAYPLESVAITEASQTRVLEVYLEDNATNLPVVNEAVIVEFFDESKGALNSMEGVTDNSGHISFNYTAPTTFSPTAADLNITFKLKNYTSIKDSVTIDFTSSLSQTDYSTYKLTAVPTAFTITTASQSKLIDLYLENNSTGTPTPGKDETIFLDYFDGTKGTVNTYSATTDVNGHVAFSYKAPTTVGNGALVTMTFRGANSTLTPATTAVTVDTTDAALLSKLQITPSSIKITKDSQVVVIDVLAFNAKNEEFTGEGNVTVRYPSEIINGTVSGGQFDQGTVTIADGKASFSFTGPADLNATNPLNFVFVSSQNSDINTTLTVNYIPEIPIIVLDDANMTVTVNGEVRTVGMTVYDSSDSVYPTGNIKIAYPKDAIDSGKDVGSFNVSTIAVGTDGRAEFTYTAPSPLDGNDSIVFSFYHDSQSEYSRADLNITITPDPDQIVITNYTLSNNYETTMNLESNQLMTFTVLDNSGNKVTDGNMTSVTVTLLNPALAELEDSNGTTGDTLSITSKNDVQMKITTDTISGIIPIRVDAKSKDANITNVFNIVVMSGPPTAMSLSYAGTEQDSEYAKFIENWVLTVTDKYSNRINTNPVISMGMMAGFATSSAVTSNVADYVYSDTTQGGTLNPDDTFTAPASVFETSINVRNDYLVLFGDGYTYDASGKWDISPVDAITNELKLNEDFNGTSRPSLGYAVGHNQRADICVGGENVVNVYQKDGNYTLPSTGSMIIKVEYAYALVGKGTMLWTNLIGDHNGTTVRIGEAKKVTLRGLGIESSEVTLSKDYNGTVSLPLTISDTIETLRNANFSYALKTDSDTKVNNVLTTSMSDIYDCDLNTTTAIGSVVYYGGQAYVDVNVTAGPSGGTIQLVNTILRNEF